MYYNQVRRLPGIQGWYNNRNSIYITPNINLFKKNNHIHDLPTKGLQKPLENLIPYLILTVTLTKAKSEITCVSKGTGK